MTDPNAQASFARRAATRPGPAPVPGLGPGPAPRATLPPRAPSPGSSIFAVVVGAFLVIAIPTVLWFLMWASHQRAVHRQGAETRAAFLAARDNERAARESATAAALVADYETPDAVVDAADWREAVDRDKHAAVRAFGNRVLEVRGRIESVNPGRPADVPNVTLRTRNPAGPLRCMFGAGDHAGQAAVVARLSPGDWVVLRGKSGGVFGGATLYDCIIASHASAGGH